MDRMYEWSGMWLRYRLLIVMALLTIGMGISVQSETLAQGDGGLGVGSGHGLEVGINLDALNQIRADIASGMYDRPCSPEEHDPTRWHTLVNVERKCHYDHHHGDDPNYVNDIFGPPGAWFDVPGQSISYPWQTFAATSADEPNTAFVAAGVMENDIKHEGYGWVVRRDQQCPNGNCVRDFRLQYHGIFGAMGATTRYHSYTLEARLCTNGNDPSTCGIVRYGGWADFGRLFTTAPDNISCAHDVRDVPINLAQDTLFRPLSRVAERDEIRCHPNVQTLPSYPSPRPVSEWWAHGPGETRFQLRSYDPIGNVNAANPSEWHFFCSIDDVSCRYNQSIMTAFIGYVLHIHEFMADGSRVDSNRDGRTDHVGYRTRWGGAGTNCTGSALDCIPFHYDNVPLNFFNNKEARYFHTVCENCPKIDYDLSPPDRKWITWFYRKYDPNYVGIPGNPGQPMPNPTPVPPSEPAIVVEVSPANPAVGDVVNVALKQYNVTGLYGLQAQCAANPAVLGGIGRIDGAFVDQNNSFYVDTGFQPDGSWMVAASRVQPNPSIDADGTAFTLSYEVLSAGDSGLNCNILAVDVNGRDLPVQVVNGGLLATEPPVVEVPDPIATVELPPVSVTTIAGSAAFQNRPDNAGILVRLLLNGGIVAEVLTGADGGYSFADVASGAYQLRFEAPQHIPTLAEVQVNADGGTPPQVEPVLLKAGDVDDNGVVDIVDATLIGANFGIEIITDITNLDLNGDGWVNISDLAMIGGNLGLTSP